MTSSFDALQSPMYLGREEAQTVFSIETKYGKSIREHSHVQNDDEIILLPGVTVKVVGSSKGEDGIQIVQLREIGPDGGNLVNSSSPIEEYHNPNLERIIRSLGKREHLVLESMNLNDQDMEIVVKLGLIEKNCGTIDLCNNMITSVGASILAQVLPGRYFFCLKLDGNRILDAGVQSLAKGLGTDSGAVKILNLNSVGMSDAGCEYLAEMLQRNPYNMYLTLNDNDISDRGVRILLETIMSPDCNTSLLTLSGNKRITDASVDIICSSMFARHYFLQMHVRNCGFSSAGKEKLQLAAQQRGGFIIYV
ncbi:unnamed protein product [Adineta ricciae]|uniref:Uncharacterized protein n=1 Tax=Adineta ricciae TaxID=249248 RepID=A0A815MGI8_ADIRI|nr:unnamed protein product [Adineta ricciae]